MVDKSASIFSMTDWSWSDVYLENFGATYKSERKTKHILENFISNFTGFHNDGQSVANVTSVKTADESNTLSVETWN